VFTDLLGAETLVPTIPEEWVKVLKTVREVYPSAVLAGGALRDLAWGLPVKDLDVFVDEADEPLVAFSGPAVPVSQTYKVAQCLEGNVGVSFIGDYCVGTAGEVMSGIVVEMGPGRTPVNLIVIRKPHGVNDFEAFVRRRMDFGACQITYDDNLVRMSPQAASDLRGRQMTLMRAEGDASVRRSVRRMERFKARMPGVTFDMSIAGKELA